MRQQQTSEYPDVEPVAHELRTVPSPSAAARPQSGRTKPILIGVFILLTLAVLFAMGYIPRMRQTRQLASDLNKERVALPEVNVAKAHKTAASNDLVLPGNTTPITEAVINARAEGYLSKRYVDIGDRVRAGQVLAEIEAPELDQQVAQARATLSQTQAALVRAQHTLSQTQANAHLSDLTVQRWKTLSDRGVVSKQEYDQKQAQFESDAALVQSAEADVRAAEDNIRASQANLQRLTQLQGYEKITAPFSGVITVRNLDVGALISTTGTTPLFRLADLSVLRLMVDVPEQSAPFVKVGEPADVVIQELAGRKITGTVSRTANSLDATTRTLPTEVQVRNPDLTILPNMFTEVKLVGARTTPAILVPGDALVVRTDGTQVAVVSGDHRVHFQHIEVGRDYGPEVEIRSGLQGDETVVVNPSDDVREGAHVAPLFQKVSGAREKK
ncbi:MAG: efflux RND transporter periplasmic adaptor subunit [Acidobacteriaceae bacterium]|nr:efflux RND transporter periplasmic adaptor subunit [Acidobacteriaceae bacterium]